MIIAQWISLISAVSISTAPPPGRWFINACGVMSLLIDFSIYIKPCNRFSRYSTWVDTFRNDLKYINQFPFIAYLLVSTYFVCKHFKLVPIHQNLSSLQWDSLCLEYISISQMRHRSFMEHHQYHWWCWLFHFCFPHLPSCFLVGYLPLVHSHCARHLIPSKITFLRDVVFRFTWNLAHVLLCSDALARLCVSYLLLSVGGNSWCRVRWGVLLVSCDLQKRRRKQNLKLKKKHTHICVCKKKKREYEY